MNLNQLTLIGRMTADAELRYRAGGTPVLEGGMAVNDYDHAAREKATLFVDFKWPNPSPREIHRYLTKGVTLCVTGRLAMERWEDRACGVTRTKHLVMVREIVYGDRRDGPAEG